MNQKIIVYISYLRTKVTLPMFIVFTVVAIGSVYAVRGVSNRAQLASMLTASEGAINTEVSNVAVVGSELPIDSAQLSTSWPGEVISYGNVPIQPQRDGTIIEWRVKIGERVEAGEVLALLSAPPAMPELVQMLAEQAEGRARMRAQAAATKRFTELNNEQLSVLLQTVETTTNGSQSATLVKSGNSGTARAAVEQVRGVATTMRHNLRTALEQTLSKHAKIVGNVNIISFFNSTSFNRMYGAGDQQNQNIYGLLFMQLVQELKNPDALPVDIASRYFSSFARLANTSIGEDLVDIREMATEDQEKFFDMLAKYREAEAMVTMKEAEYGLEYAEQKKEIQEKIAENEKMSAMADAEAIAAETAYTTVERSIVGGLAITAPRSGVISTINKKVGDFVEPGMPVASINTDRALERFVRFQIPSNIRTPKVGEILSVVRPGFSQDVQKIKLTGVGTSLDMTGAYMADASFLTPVDWPVAVSVRVLVPQNGTTPIIKLSSLLWDADGKPYVWGVSEAGRIFARKIIVGRTLGSSVEVYEGLKNGDRYIITPTSDMKEDMLFDDGKKTNNTTSTSAKSSGEESMGGMEM
ncbi:MAG: HlyD family efflux transporter periplasmic adaptor subunit [Parcubacteria group bacterium]|nr:HlyD family efflux transporter periplasmic adaptor subunit [Parcubacteria group bacterium]